MLTVVSGDARLREIESEIGIFTSAYFRIRPALSQASLYVDAASAAAGIKAGSGARPAASQ